ncbi:type II secretion system F family protein [uncultured Desulfobacter sp.]|uniref:type II secretion system F family protein n=1 Tax=uncultured Desulfobacter sp. TaxID=240139 RepID=UPI002AAAAC91|nr:type II secretion system F family protein [uncultured Desulfobacter sp.]
MSTFTYTAINETGSVVKGEIEASSQDSAVDKIALKGLIPEKVKEKTGGGSGFFSSLEDRLTTIKARDLVLFTKQFKTLIHAGVPMMDVLTTMEIQTENKRLKKVVSQIRVDIREGGNLFSSFAKHPDVFSQLYCNMLHAGETSGALPDVLERLIYIIDHEDKLKSDIKSAMRYPMMVTSFLGVAFLVLLNFVIPKFVKVFESAKLELPLPTQICIIMHKAMHDYWLIGIIAGGAILAAVYYIFFKTPPGILLRDQFLLKVPIVGPVVSKAAMSRFASIFAILQTSGITVLESIDVLTKTINNAAITKEFIKIKEMLTAGRGISQPLKSSKYFPPMVINMVAIGEETGNLDDMLTEISHHYDAEVEYSTKAMSEAIGPILVVGLAAVVGFFALAIFLPMWDLTKMVK